VANIKEQSPYPAIILLDGEGYKDGAKEWLKNKLTANCFLEFLIWVNLQSGLIKEIYNRGVKLYIVTHHTMLEFINK
jgi:hypothetical protein